MAYYVNTTPTNEGIPQNIVDFAVNTLGWNEISTGVVAAPGADAGVGFKFTYELIAAGRYQQQLLVHLVKGGVVANSAPLCVPYIGGTFQAPTRLHLFGGVASTPYLGIAIEFSPGMFRHGYVGYLEKIGSYGGGEVITSSYFTKIDDRNWGYQSYENKYPFSGMYFAKPVTEGCVRIVHADVGADDIVLTSAAGRRDASNVVANRTFGGFLDNINDEKLARGFNTFAGSHILVPINMFRSLPENRVQPIGRPSGVRMIRMDNLDPAAPIHVGNKTWRCFPVFKKHLTTSVSTSSYSDETSYVIGIAYQED